MRGKEKNKKTDGNVFSRGVKLALQNGAEANKIVKNLDQYPQLQKRARRIIATFVSLKS